MNTKMNRINFNDAFSTVINGNSFKDEKILTPQSGWDIKEEEISPKVKKIILNPNSDSIACRGLKIRLDFLSDNPGLWQTASESFHFIPNIKNDPADICGSHAFRSPVVMLSCSAYDKKGIFCALVPDLDNYSAFHGRDYYLDMRFDPDNKTAPFAEYGLIPHDFSGHRYYRPNGGELTIEPGFTLSFYLISLEGSAPEGLRFVSDFLFGFGEKYIASALPQTVPYETYALYGNAYAIAYMRENAKKIHNARGGGICLSTFERKDGLRRGREYADDIWFHAWFNNMRTAHELYYYGKKSRKTAWVNCARSIASLLLSAPQKNGFFPTIYAPHDDGFVLSSRHGGGKDFYSLPDMAWSSLWLMKYNDEIEVLTGADGFLRGFADGLLNYKGIFPCWVTPEGETKGSLDSSTSAAMPMWFLAEYAKGNRDSRYAKSAKDCGDLLINEFLPCQKFEDFELYFSCSRKPEGFYDKISRMWGQNTLAIQWCAEGFLALYKLYGEEKYLTAAVYCADLLCLYQQVWNPPFLSLYAFGGFGVMNTDAEWNDARQAQFAETFANFFEATGNGIYLKRAAAALKASFTLVAMKENKEVSPNTYEGCGHFFEVHGSSSENYGHSGRDTRAYQSGFHWGTGSALVSAARLTEKWGDVFVYEEKGSVEAVGLGGAAVVSFQTNNGNAVLTIDSVPGQKELVIKNSAASVKNIKVKNDDIKIYFVNI